MRVQRNIVLAFLLLVPTGTAAAAPQADALFGGGAIGTGTRGGADADTHFLGARIGKTDTSRLTFYADVALKCPKHGTTLASVAVEDVQVGADGTFAGKTDYSGAGPLGSEGGPVEFTGRFLTDTRIAGTVSAKSTVRLTGKAPYQCSSGPVEYVMVDNVNDANAAPIQPGGSYVGTTNDGFSALVRLDSAGTGFAKAAVQANLKCKNAKNGVFSVDIIPGRLLSFGEEGRFGGIERFTTRRAYVKPAFSRISWKLDGRFADGKLTGVWTAKMRVFHRKRTKQLIDTCAARVPFTAALA